MILYLYVVAVLIGQFRWHFVATVQLFRGNPNALTCCVNKRPHGLPRVVALTGALPRSRFGLSI